MQNKTSKIKQVEQHLKKYKKITSWEAITKYKATRLSSIIFTLKERGLNIKSVRTHGDDGVHFATYRLN